MPLLHSRSFGSISGLLDQPLSATLARRPTTPDKPLPLTPQPSDPIPLSDDPDDDDDTLLPTMSTSSRSSATTGISGISKRNHALTELLTSERSYASDLALIGDVYIPLALGQPAPFSATPATPPGSSASSSRTLSTASDSSYLSTGGPPMTRDDAKIIFNNVTELALFADDFAADLEKALGDVLEGGTGDDWVGKLILQKVPTMDSLYQTYIAKQPTAVEHLNSLPSTPALAAYIAQTQTLAATLTHAWDLPSLLIKPLQRLLKYPLLLETIIQETPKSHPDLANLIEARKKLQEIALSVNEERRRREVIREVLAKSSGTATPQKSELKAKKKGLNVGVAASVSLGRMKSIRSAALKAKEGPEANEEAEAVKDMGERLRECEAFMHKLARDSTKWADSVRDLMLALDAWAQSFGRVIWMGENDVRSEAFDAFLSLISDQLLPICDETKAAIVDKLLPQISALVDSTTAPSRLLEAMQTLEPLHYGLLNINVAKSRPPPQLLEASQSYVALRAQLFAELPEYLRLFDKGIATSIYRFTLIQQRFYSNVRDRWSDLWDALKVDEEANQGAAETLRVWWSRFAEVEVQLRGLNIVRPLEKKHTPEKLKLKSSGKQRLLNEGDTTHTAVVSSVLAALDPLSIPRPSPSAPSFAASPAPLSGKTRSVYSMESENRPMAERKSLESLHSRKSGKSRRPSSSRGNSMAGSTLVDEPAFGYPLAALAPVASKPAYARTKSMPLSPAPLNKSRSAGKYLDVEDPSPNNSSSASLQSVAATLQEDTRGRPARKPSFRRRLTDSFRSNAGVGTSSVDTRHRRSPSLPTYSATPSPSPRQATFANGTGTNSGTGSGSRRRPSGGAIPALYQCRVIHMCEPPPGVSYRDIPFFTLRVDDVYDILQEAGHPSTHRDLPLYVDDGEDCLLLARSESGDVGWVLASFLLPVD
ncbi:hypothetical protein C8Q80DRAFT_1096780 [Daedaleopsis nitida]|nr:hypothetical protein C8Q80DRAFT_1096780 [Daedaleopsis nitida]